MISDDAEEVIKGKLTANKIIDLVNKLNNEEQELYKIHVSSILMSNKRRSTSIHSNDKHDDGSNEELKEKMLDQEEEIRNIENELSTKRKDIYDLNAKLSRIQNEYDAMVSKNKLTNMDLVEARLLFKQQCCVLV